jgi:hypothetical protein
MKIRISGSRAHRVWKCPASAVLPQVESTEQHPLAGRGKLVHRFLERAKETERAVATAEAPEELRPFLECLDLDALPIHVATEVTLAWDWKHRRGRELGRNLDRGYTIDGFLESIGVAPLGPTEHAVTVDVLGFEQRGAIKLGLVGDYKTGRTRYPAPDRYGQTMLGALAARSVYGFDEVVLDLYYIDEDGETFPCRRRVDEWDLDVFADSWASANALVEEYEPLVESGVNPTVVEGPHCEYCPAFKSCPAKLALVSRLPVAIDDLKTRSMTVARAAQAWLALEAMGDLISAMKSEITSLAAVEDIELPDGRVIGRHVTERRGLDPKIAIPILRSRFGDAAVDRATKQTIALGAIKDAVSIHVGEVNAKKAKGERRLAISTKDETGEYDRLIQEIDQARGVEYRRTEAISPYVPKRR